MMIARRTRFVRHLNQLANSKNPYLLSHANNPVDWNIWSRETLELAKSANKPIFLSVGYRSCHWCHVMNHESFSNSEIAEELNANFIPIKIDKEEYPDLDGIYMMYLQATTGAGGWPLNVFLTPQLEPIFGGTYWAGPGVPEKTVQTLKAVPFMNVIKAVHNQWVNNNEECVNHAKEMTQKLSALVSSKTAEGVDLKPQVISEAETNLLEIFDEKSGGYGRAPKFPLPATLKFAIASSNTDVRFSAIKTLNDIYKGGIKDQISHGIARYSVSADWHFPHFEKMLIDQALMLDVALEDPSCFDLAHDLVDFLIKGPLKVAESGWYSGVDADSFDTQGKSREGEYYVWTYQEFEAAFKGAPLLDADICAMYFGVNERGNVNEDLDTHGDFAYKNVLSVYTPIREIAKTFGRTEKDIERVVSRGKKRLLEWRQKNKEAPAVDAKIVNGWNGLVIGTLAKASVILGRSDALAAAVSGARAIYSEKWHEAFSRTAEGEIPAVNDDYAYMIQGLLDFYEALPHRKILQLALDLQKQQIQKFWDPRGGFYASQDWEWLIYRPKTAFDSAEPSSNGVSLRNLWRLGCMTSNTDYIHKCQQLIDAFSADIEQQPTGYLSMLRTIPKVSSPQCAAIIADSEEAEALTAEARKTGLPIVLLNKDSVHLLPNLAHFWTENKDARVEIIDTK